MMHPTHKQYRTDRLVANLALCACVLIGRALTAQPSQPIQQHANQETGIRVIDVGPLQGGQRAGLQHGDLLTGWSFQQSSGVFESPFDLALIEDEYAQRGTVEITGVRNRTQIRWMLKDAAWKISTSPLETDSEATGESETRRLEVQGRFDEAGAGWEALAKSATGTNAAWFYQSAARTFASGMNWPAADRDFEASIRAAAQSPAVSLEINSAWGDTFQARALWKDAAQRYQAGLAYTDKLDARVTRARLLLSLAQGYKRQRRPTDGLPLSQEALEIRKALLPQTSSLAQAYLLTGSFFIDLQQFDKAETFLTEAQKITQSTSQPNILQAGVLHNLGLLKLARGEIAQARIDLENSLKISGELEPNGEQFASTNSSLGNLLRAQGDLASAEKHLQLSLEVRKRATPQSLAVSSALINLANLHRVKGDFVPAQSEYEEALRLIKKLAPDSSEEAGIWMDLGGLAQSRGDLALAANYYTRSEELWSKIAPRSAQWAHVVVDLGQVRQDQDNLKEAERLYNEAIAIPGWQKESPIARAGVDRALGELYAKENRADESIDFNKKALTILTEVVPGSLDQAETAEHLGELEQGKGEWNEAERYFQQSLDIHARLVPDTSDLAQSLHGMGMVAQHGGNKEKAIALLSQAVDALEAQSARLGGSELVNAGFRATFSQYYRDLADALLSVDQNEAAFHITERYRARTLLDQLALRSISLSGAPPKLTSQLRANADEYEELQAQILRQSPTSSSVQADKLHGRLLELSASRAKTIEDIRHQSPAFAQLRFPEALTVNQVQAALDPGTLLVSFLVEPQRTFVFVIGSRDPHPVLSVFSVPIDESTLQAKIQDFRSAIQGSGPQDRSRLKQEARELYELLLRPADSMLNQSERVIILPDGPLYLLPFPALLRKDQFLVQWKAVSITLSATLLAQLKQERKPPEAYQVSLAAFGDAIYRREAKEKPQAANPDKHLRTGADDLAPLTHSKQEVESIAQLFPHSSRLYEGADATEEHAKTLGTDVRFIHFSLHGLLNEDQPLDSSLAFSTPVRRQSGGENGFLQAWELYEGPRWDADLVVLSACDSGLGKELAGEGLVGLTRAVHYAGARSVISSLWKVDDQKSEQLMVELYKNLSKGMPKDEALRTAQLSLLQSRAGAAPYYWAAFSLQGDWK